MKLSEVTINTFSNSAAKVAEVDARLREIKGPNFAWKSSRKAIDENTVEVRFSFMPIRPAIELLMTSLGFKKVGEYHVATVNGTEERPVKSKPKAKVVAVPETKGGTIEAVIQKSAGVRRTVNAVKEFLARRGCRKSILSASIDGTQITVTITQSIPDSYLSGSLLAAFGFVKQENSSNRMRYTYSRVFDGPVLEHPTAVLNEMAHQYFSAVSGRSIDMADSGPDQRADSGTFINVFLPGYRVETGPKTSPFPYAAGKTTHGWDYGTFVPDVTAESSALTDDMISALLVLGTAHKEAHAFTVSNQGGFWSVIYVKGGAIVLSKAVTPPEVYKVEDGYLYVREIKTPHLKNMVKDPVAVYYGDLVKLKAKEQPVVKSQVEADAPDENVAYDIFNVPVVAINPSETSKELALFFAERGLSLTFGQNQALNFGATVSVAKLLTTFGWAKEPNSNLWTQGDRFPLQNTSAPDEFILVGARTAELKFRRDLKVRMEDSNLSGSGNTTTTRFYVAASTTGEQLSNALIEEGIKQRPFSALYCGRTRSGVFAAADAFLNMEGGEATLKVSFTDEPRA